MNRAPNKRFEWDAPTAVSATCFRAPQAARYVSVNNGATIMRIVFTLLISLFLASCETIPTSTSSKPTSPSSFTTENIMKVHPGMSSDEILQLFGEPKSIRSAVCGREPNQWVCTTWEYGEFRGTRASFTFSGEHGSYILNNFNVGKD